MFATSNDMSALKEGTMTPRFFDVPYWKNAQTYCPLVVFVGVTALEAVWLRQHHLTGNQVQAGFALTGIMALPLIVILQYWFYAHYKQKEGGPSEGVRKIGDWSSRILILTSIALLALWQYFRLHH